MMFHLENEWEKLSQYKHVDSEEEVGEREVIKRLICAIYLCKIININYKRLKLLSAGETIGRWSAM